MAMHSGGVMGIVLIIGSLLTWIIGLPMDHWFNSTLTYAVIIGGLYYFIKQYRDNDMGGYMSYGQVVGAGVVISAFTALLYDFYFWIYLSFLNPEAIDQIKELAYNSAISMGQSEEQAIQGLEMMSFMYTPSGMVIMGLLNTIILGLIISLITGIFLKRNNPNPFEGTEA